MAKSKNSQKEVDLKQIEQENKELFQQLTNKNSEYMVSLNRRLKEMDVAKSVREYHLYEMMKEIIPLQDEAITARRHFGTVTDRAELIVGGKVSQAEEEEPSPRWMIYLDGALLLGGIFAVIYGIGQMSGQDDPDKAFGLAQIIGNYLFGGWAMLTLTQYMPKQGQTKGLGKYILMSILVMFTWVFVVNLMLAFLPPVINPKVPAPALIIVGLGSIALKMYLKKKWNIQGTMF